MRVFKSIRVLADQLEMVRFHGSAIQGIIVPVMHLVLLLFAVTLLRKR